jgi:hypothetical protein
MGQVLGSDLMAHLDREAMLHVDPSLDLVVPTLIIVRDDAHAGNARLTMGVIRRPSPDERAA